MWRQRQRSEWCWPRKPEEAMERFSPSASAGSTFLLISWSWTYGLQNYRRFHFCCFKLDCGNLPQQLQEANTGCCIQASEIGRIKIVLGPSRTEVPILSPSLTILHLSVKNFKFPGKRLWHQCKDMARESLSLSVAIPEKGMSSWTGSAGSCPFPVCVPLFLTSLWLTTL